MTNRTLTSKWLSEYCAPVVITVTTAEAEGICLKNGLLLHELLSAFGHLDGINAIVRSGAQNYSLPDTHVRFERVTEMRARTGDVIEEMMKQNFKEFELNRLPNNVQELKVSPPSAWSPLIEQIAMRSMAFTEFEMLSSPLIYLTVIATTDVDPIACVQELISMHHVPTCVSNGQYEPNIQRVHLILEDASEPGPESGLIVQRKMLGKFPQATIKLLSINSLPVNSPNLQQPDMWSAYLLPNFFPQHAPQLDPSRPLPANPMNGEVAIGTRLSMEDFIKLQEFCLLLFNQEILPALERRLVYLNKQVNDARKGFKNVVKSFWRKPKDESEIVRGGIKYKYDKIESQILLLGDTSFIIKDYETAATMYRSVRDDFKSDKSMLHLAHTCLMLAACTMITEPNRQKDLHGHLEVLSQVLTANIELPHANLYFGLMAADMYVFNYSTRSPLEAAKLLLQTANNLSKFPMMSALLVDRAAMFFLQTQYSRKYVLHTVLAGNKLHRCGVKPAQHALVCFASVMILLDRGHWGDLKSKLCYAIANDLKASSRENAQRSLLLLLKMLYSIVDEKNKDVGNKSSLNDAVNVLQNVVGEGLWGSILVSDGWTDYSTRQILLSDLPIGPINIFENQQQEYKQRTQVTGLPIPEVYKDSVSILCPLNGKDSLASYDMATSEQKEAEEMRIMLELEKQWIEANDNIIQANENNTSLGFEISDSKSTPMTNATNDLRSLSDKWAEVEAEIIKSKNKSSSQTNTPVPVARIPLGESLMLKLIVRNNLPIDLALSKMKLMMTPEEKFQTTVMDVLLSPDVSNEVILNSLPLECGEYHINSAKWNISDFFTVQCSLNKPGPLLQKTLKQREKRERGENKSLYFEVIPSHPLLHIAFEGLSAEVLQGQLLKTSLILSNQGGATACNIYIKLSQPSFVFYMNNDSNDNINNTTRSSQNQLTGLLGFYGKSSTIVKIDESITIPPGGQLKLEAWLRITQPGLQRISLLASYKALRDDGSKEFFGPGPICRTSFISVETTGLPSIGVNLRLSPKPSSAMNCSLVAEIANHLPVHPSQGSIDINDMSRFSSYGQIEISNFNDEFLDVDENYLKVVGVWLLGAAQSSKSSTQNNNPPNLITSPNERVVGCFPLQLLDQTNNINNAHKNQITNSVSWLLPFSSATPAISPMNNNRSNSNDTNITKNSEIDTQFLFITSIMEQFLCLSATREQFELEIEESRNLLIAAELEADNAGPRTIAQVRRDRLKQETQKNNAHNNNRESLLFRNVYNDEDNFDEFQNVFSDWNNNNCNNNDNNNNSESIIMNGMNLVPKNVDDLSVREASKSSMSIAIFWISRWEGKIRWGMHNTANLSFIQALNNNNNNNNNHSKNLTFPSLKKSSLIASDYLMVGLNHPEKIILTNSFLLSMSYIPVQIHLKSVCDEVLLLTVEAVDSEKISRSSNSSNDNINISPSIGSEQTQQLGLRIEKTVMNGFRWVGKTQYTQIKLNPHDEIILQFYAFFSQSGVYDLKRFKVAVNFERETLDTDVPVSYFKRIPGQCLIEAIDSDK
eukprot:gene5036-7027_t